MKFIYHEKIEPVTCVLWFFESEAGDQEFSEQLKATGRKFKAFSKSEKIPACTLLNVPAAWVETAVPALASKDGDLLCCHFEAKAGKDVLVKSADFLEALKKLAAEYPGASVPAASPAASEPAKTIPVIPATIPAAAAGAWKEAGFLSPEAEEAYNKAMSAGRVFIAASRKIEMPNRFAASPAADPGSEYEAEWDRSPALREEFNGNFAAFESYMTASKNGRVKVFKI